MTLANIETGEIAAQPNLWLDQAVGHHVAGDLTADEALAVTSKIKAYVGATWVLIAAAHDRKAHKALGYKTWADYVQTEFDISRSRSYQLISQARVIIEISESVSTMVDISEREARDLEPAIDEAKQAAKDAVADLPDDAGDEDKSEAVTKALDELRDRMVGARRPKFPPPATSAEPEPSEPEGPSDQADADLINDAVEKHADPRLTFRANFSKDLAKAGTLRMVDIDKAIASADPDDLAGFRQSVQSIRDWCDRFLDQSNNAHLRRVK